MEDKLQNNKAIKLPLFNTNDVKYFKFTPEQYILLEMEYNRYIIYKELVKKIENLFKLNTDKQNNTIRKIYENKNIIERFVLECINHGISPQFNTNLNSNEKLLENIETIKCIESIDIEYLRRYIFFNKNLSNEAIMKEMPYFKKMISEYIEKKFHYTYDKEQQLLKNFATANYKYTKIVNELYINYKNPKYVVDITCSLLCTNTENYIITYRGYSKVINFKRYAKLIRNYDRAFPFDILYMLLRYSLFDMSNQQWSIGITLYEEISMQLDIGFEMFASPLNFNMNMFCSLFLDTDKTFGSIGSFYNITVNKLLNMGVQGVFYNPPYLPLLMSTTTKMCIELLDKMRMLSTNFTIVSFLPNWTDANYLQTFKTSHYTVFHQVIPKGQYILHEKDRGKLIRGTFDLLFIVMNSKHEEWNDSKRCNFIKICYNIIKIMNNELQETY